MNEAESDRRFPRSSKYAFEWIKEGSMGSHVLWMTEWLCEHIDLRPGMRVLDLGCGRAKSSIFLAREFGVEVWATDLWIAATENWQRVRDAGLEDRVFPIHADARALPFAAEFFDAITALDCYSYFGTDDLYLNYLAQFVKPGGPIGIAGAGFVNEISIAGAGTSSRRMDAGFLVSAFDGVVAAALGTNGDCRYRGGRLDGRRLEAVVAVAAGGWPDNTGEIAMVEADAGRNLTYVRLVGRRREGVKLVDYCWPDTMRSMPQQYEKKAITQE